MTSDPPTAVPPDPEGLSVDLASTLLQLGLTGPRRPVDGLIERLSEPEASVWLDDALRRVCGDLAAPTAVLLEGRASVEELTAIKERSKRLLKRAGDSRDSLVGVAGYFFSIAAGLRHHGRRIGGRGRDELDPILLDLAEVAPPEYSRMLSDATLASR